MRIKCPEEMSLVSFADLVTGGDSFKWAEMLSPQPTAVTQLGYQIGREAIRLLLREIDKSEGSKPSGPEGDLRLPVEYTEANRVVLPALAEISSEGDGTKQSANNGSWGVC